jgi:hypothetical protein
MNDLLNWDVFVAPGIPTVTSDLPPGTRQGMRSPISSTLIYGKRDAVLVEHKRPGSADSPKIIEETRQHIRDFDGIVGTTTTARELYDKMLEIYPGRVNPGALWLSARAVKP